MALCHWLLKDVPKTQPTTFSSFLSKESSPSSPGWHLGLHGASPATGSECFVPCCLSALADTGRVHSWSRLAYSRLALSYPCLWEALPGPRGWMKSVLGTHPHAGLISSAHSPGSPIRLIPPMAGWTPLAPVAVIAEPSGAKDGPLSFWEPGRQGG